MNSMKRSVDSIHDATLVDYVNSTIVCNSEDKMILSTLPEDVIISIFSLLSESTLRQLSSVCKIFKKCAQSDILWQNIATNFLISHVIKPQNLAWKEFCRDFLSPSKIYKASTSRKYHTFRLRDLLLVERIKQLNLPDFRLLNYSEAKSLFQKECTLKLIQVTAKVLKIQYFAFRHVAQQKVGEIQFDFFNCTDLVISFAGDNRTMHINGDPVNKRFTKEDCQLVICYSDKRLHVLNSDLDKDRIQDLSCDMEALKSENLKTIAWKSMNVTSKIYYSQPRIFLKEIGKELEFIKLNLPDFTVLNNLEAKYLIDSEDSTHFFETLALYINPFDDNYRIPSLRYCGQQKLGENMLHLFNSSKYLISINPRGDLLLNNKLTKFKFSPKSWQLFVDSPSYENQIVI